MLPVGWLRAFTIILFTFDVFFNAIGLVRDVHVMYRGPGLVVDEATVMFAPTVKDFLPIQIPHQRAVLQVSFGAKDDTLFGVGCEP